MFNIRHEEIHALTVKPFKLFWVKGATIHLEIVSQSSRKFKILEKHQGA